MFAKAHLNWCKEAQPSNKITKFRVNWDDKDNVKCKYWIYEWDSKIKGRSTLITNIGFIIRIDSFD